MHKSIAIFLLSVFIFSNTELRELGKIGALVGHYQEHKNNDAKITFLEFIHLHYFSGFVRDDDFNRDQQLPFKVIDCAAPGIVLTLPPVAILELKTPELVVSNKILPQTQSFSSSCHFSDIWQPPKRA